MIMVFERLVARALVLLLVVVVWNARAQADSTAGDYQAPNFDAKVFDRDAISLEGRELADVMDALTAVVRNFDSVAYIDNDVKEKALALALRLQPLNPAARAAHQLMSGGQGPAVGYESLLSYSDTAKIFEVLAVQGERLMRERAQPDDEILGPLLMEIGLTVLSQQEWNEPESQKLAHVFHEVGGKGEMENFWKLTVRLQSIPGDGASLLASRLKNLQPFEEVKTEGENPAVNPSVQDQTQSISNGTTSTDSSQAVGENLQDTSVMFLADVLGAGGASLADALIEIVEADPGANANDSGSESKMPVRLVKAGPENSALRGVSAGQSWVKRTFSRWPDGKQAVVRLMLGDEDEVSVGRAPGERWPVEVSLPMAMVMYSALSETQIAADVAVSGRIESSGAIKPVLPRSEVLREVSENVERIAILALAPDEAAGSDELTSLFEIEVLGRVQVIDVGSFEELQQVAVANLRPPELTAAMAEFAELQGIGIRSRNLSEPGLREKLAAVLQLWPGHYSARRLLAASSAGGPMPTSSPLPVPLPAPVPAAQTAGESDRSLAPQAEIIPVGSGSRIKSP